jgi:hypothetical protein
MISESPDLLFMPSLAIDVSRVTLNDFGYSPRNVKNLSNYLYPTKNVNGSPQSLIWSVKSDKS